MIYDRAIDTIEAGGWQYHVDFQEMFHLQSHVMFILYAVSFDIHKYTFVNMWNLGNLLILLDHHDWYRQNIF